MSKENISLKFKNTQYNEYSPVTYILSMFYKQYTDLQYKLLNLEIWNMFRFGWYLIWENRVPLFFITISTAIPSNIIAYYIIQNELFPIHDGIRGVKDLENIYKFSA